MRRGHAALIASEGPSDEANALEGRSNIDIDKHRRRSEVKATQAQVWLALARELGGQGDGYGHAGPDQPRPSSSESAQHLAADRGLGGPGPLAWTVTSDASQLGRPQAAQRVAGRVGLVHGVPPDRDGERLFRTSVALGANRLGWQRWNRERVDQTEPYRRGDARRPGTADRTSAGRPGRDDPTAWSSMPQAPGQRALSFTRTVQPCGVVATRCGSARGCQWARRWRAGAGSSVLAPIAGRALATGPTTVAWSSRSRSPVIDWSSVSAVTRVAWAGVKAKPQNGHRKPWLAGPAAPAAAPGCTTHSERRCSLGHLLEGRLSAACCASSRGRVVVAGRPPSARG